MLIDAGMTITRIDATHTRFEQEEDFAGRE
jgi:hypothetical protein